MTASIIEHFSTVEYIHDLRQADFTEKQAEAVAKIIEHQAQLIQEQKNEIDSLKSKELATKGDVNEIRTEIYKSKYEVILWIAGMLFASGLIQHFFK